jgi:hypothetical protein
MIAVCWGKEIGRRMIHKKTLFVHPYFKRLSVQNPANIMIISLLEPLIRKPGLPFNLSL